MLTSDLYNGVDKWPVQWGWQESCRMGLPSNLYNGEEVLFLWISVRLEATVQPSHCPVPGLFKPKQQKVLDNMYSIHGP